MLGVVHTTDSVSGKTEPNVIHHTITVLIKFFLFLEVVFFSHFDPQKNYFFLFSYFVVVVVVLSFFSIFLYVNRLQHRLANLIGSFSLMPYS